MTKRVAALAAAALLSGGNPVFTQTPASGAEAIGIFSGSTDVGTPSTIGAGSARFDPATRVYTIAGGGENMWAAADHFRYVWTKVSGDVSLEAIDRLCRYASRRPACPIRTARRR